MLIVMTPYQFPVSLELHSVCDCVALGMLDCVAAGFSLSSGSSRLLAESQFVKNDVFPFCFRSPGLPEGGPFGDHFGDHFRVHFLEIRVPFRQ